MASIMIRVWYMPSIYDGLVEEGIGHRACSIPCQLSNCCLRWERCRKRVTSHGPDTCMYCSSRFTLHGEPEQRLVVGWENAQKNKQTPSFIVLSKLLGYESDCWIWLAWRVKAAAIHAYTVLLHTYSYCWHASHQRGNPLIAHIRG